MQSPSRLRRYLLIYFFFTIFVRIKSNINKKLHLIYKFLKNGRPKKKTNPEPPEIDGGAPFITVGFWCHTIDQTSSTHVIKKAKLKFPHKRANNNFGGRSAKTSTTEFMTGHIIPDSCLSPTRGSQDPGQVHRPIMSMMFDHLRVFIGDKYTHLRQVLREENGPVKNIIPVNESLRLQYDAGRVFLRFIKSSEPNRQYLQLLRTTPRDPLRLESKNDKWDSSRTQEDEELERGYTGPTYSRHGDVFLHGIAGSRATPIPLA